MSTSVKLRRPQPRLICYLIGDDGKVVGAANVGGLAVGVPGEVAGLLYGLGKYGSKKLSRAQIMQPSIDWAQKGIPVTVNLSKIIKDELVKINKFPATAKLYSNEGLPETGDTIKNPELAATPGIDRQTRQGRFYKGELARKVVAAVKEAGGIMTEAGLAAYDRRSASRSPVLIAAIPSSPRHRPVRRHACDRNPQHSREFRYSKTWVMARRRRSTSGVKR